MHLWKMPKKASGRNQKCRQHVVEMFPANEGRENGWAQIGISACVLLLPPVLAIAVLAPRSFRPESGETPAVFEVAESSSTSLPVTEGRFGRPSRLSKLSGIGPTQFDDRFPKEASIPSAALGGLAQEMPPSAQGEDIMAESRAEPEIQATPSQPAARLDIKSGDARSLPPPPGTSARQVSNRNGADAVLDAQSTSRVHTSTCLPSASAVRQDHPGAWPSWTLHALGHQGTKCWYAGNTTRRTKPEGARP
jgi:hypothetical protein